MLSAPVSTGVPAGAACYLPLWAFTRLFCAAQELWGRVARGRRVCREFDHGNTDAYGAALDAPILPAWSQLGTPPPVQLNAKTLHMVCTRARSHRCRLGSCAKVPAEETITAAVADPRRDFAIPRGCSPA
jgi:hypothetical protein